MHHKSQKTASYTYGALDPVQVIQMGKYLDTIYVSGWQCSSTASTTNEPGPDLADYPMVLYFYLGYCSKQGRAFVLCSIVS
jgi:isocitrate lyase